MRVRRGGWEHKLYVVFGGGNVLGIGVISDRAGNAWHDTPPLAALELYRKVLS